MSADETSDEQGYREARGIDPYIAWALGPGRPHFFLRGRQNEWMPVLVRLRGISARDFAAGSLFIEDPERRKRWQESVHVSPLFIESPAAADAAPYCTAMVREEFFGFVKSDEQVRAVVDGVTLGLPLDSESLPPFKGKTTPGKNQR
jgi:hypothetical protein